MASFPRMSLRLLESYGARDENDLVVYVPEVPRSRITPGIVHLGVGGFHRAHQALYTMEILRYDPSWGILGVGLLPSDESIRDALARQDFCYSLIEKGHLEDQRGYLVHSILGMKVVPLDGVEDVLETMSKKEIRIVSLTVTEKGYCFDGNREEIEGWNPMVVADMKDPERPVSAMGLIVTALKRRWRSGIPPFTVLSCDNLPMNGRVVRKAVMQLAARMFPGIGLVEWMERACCFPSTMVDGITPVPTKEDVELVQRLLRIHDEVPSVREPFRQWVIEDSFVGGCRPPWHLAGAQFVVNVEPYELAKIRLLNVPHSAIAYAGSLLGLQFIHQSASDQTLELYLRALMEEISPTLEKPCAETGILDLVHYRNVLVFRFQNAAIQDTIDRVAQDGSAKYANQLVPIVKELLGMNRSVKFLAFAVAAWALHLRGKDLQGRSLNVFDPRKEELMGIMQSASGLMKLLSDHSIFGSLVDEAGALFRDQVVSIFASMERDGVRVTASRMILSRRDRLARVGTKL